MLLVKDLYRYNPASYAGPLDPARYDAEVAAARAAGEPVFEIVYETPWGRKTDAETAYRAIFAEIGTGLTFLSMHFNAAGRLRDDQPEGRLDPHRGIRALPDRPKIAEWIDEFGLELIGMRGAARRAARGAT